jgi:hypothetical protein
LPDDKLPPDEVGQHLLNVQVQVDLLHHVIKLFSLIMKPNKPLEALSSQVLEFEGKARANPIGGPFRCFLLG